MKKIQKTLVISNEMRDFLSMQIEPADYRRSLPAVETRDLFSVLQKSIVNYFLLVR